MVIVKVLYMNLLIILVDEFIVVLDIENVIEVIKILCDQVKKRKKVCIIVIYDEWFKVYCDRLYYMKDGVFNFENEIVE